jgi:hypothetical protein
MWPNFIEEKMHKINNLILQFSTGNLAKFEENIPKFNFRIPNVIISFLLRLKKKSGSWEIPPLKF